MYPQTDDLANRIWSFHNVMIEGLIFKTLTVMFDLVVAFDAHLRGRTGTVAVIEEEIDIGSVRSK